MLEEAQLTSLRNISTWDSTIIPVLGAEMKDKEHSPKPQDKSLGDTMPQQSIEQGGIEEIGETPMLQHNLAIPTAEPRYTPHDMSQ